MRASSQWKRFVVAAAIFFMLVFPIIKSNPYMLYLFSLFYLWSVVAVNWNLLFGYAGIWSMGNLAFMAIGSYTSAMISLYWGWSPWVCIPIGGLASMVSVTIIIGIPSLRLGGIYIALLTLAFSLVLPTLATQTRSVTGGAVGLDKIPPLFENITRFHSYYINLAVFVVFLSIVYKTIHSLNGLAFIALRDSRELSVSLGINEYKEKLKVFALTSLMTGISGGFYVHYVGAITPSILDARQFVMTMAMMTVGGLGRFPGAALGTALIIFGGEWLRLAGNFRFSLLGGLICLVILFSDGGLMGFVDWLAKKLVSALQKREEIAEV